ncbi:MAG: hypothetical protein AAFX94_20260, partial [Myxococcota bacterium]
AACGSDEESSQEETESLSCSEVYPLSGALATGTTSTGLYDTVTPFEHADVERSHVYRADFAGSVTDPASNTVDTFAFSGTHESPYNIVTRDPDEVFLFGGTQGDQDEALGPYVAKFDAGTGEVLWRTDLRNTKELGEFLWPGLVTAHGNGDLYAIHGSRIARLDASTGAVKGEVELPVPQGTDRADIHFNGFTVLRSGTIVTKSFGRPDGCTAQGTDVIAECVTDETPHPPSILVAVDSESLSVIDSFQLDQGSSGRITSGLFGARELIYVPGDENFVRFELVAGELVIDELWSVDDYLEPGETPASAPAIMGDWIVFQTNSGLSTAPLSVHAVAQEDSSNRLRTVPFTPSTLGFSAIPSALTVDPETLRIYAMDAIRGQVASLELVDGNSLEVRWIVDQFTLHHTSLVGPPEARVFVGTDAPGV